MVRLKSIKAFNSKGLLEQIEVKGALGITLNFHNNYTIMVIQKSGKFEYYYLEKSYRNMIFLDWTLKFEIMPLLKTIEWQFKDTIEIWWNDGKYECIDVEKV